MKKKIYIITLFGLGLTAYAQQSGKLGVNVANPEATLEIKQKNTATTKVLTLRDNTGTELVTVQADGKMGVGVNSPTVKLDINGKVKIQEIPAGNVSTDQILVAGTDGVVKKVVFPKVKTVELEGTVTDYAPTAGKLFCSIPKSSTNIRMEKIVAINQVVAWDKEVSWGYNPQVNSFRLNEEYYANPSEPYAMEVVSFFIPPTEIEWWKRNGKLGNKCEVDVRYLDY